MLAKQYDDVIDFTLGDPDIPTPGAICEAADRAAKAGKTRYAPNGGIPELRESIARNVSSYTGIRFYAENVAVTVGATQAVFLSFMACINPGDEVIILAPYWVQYENIVKLLGGTPVIIDRFKEGFEPDLTAIREAINERTRVIVVNSPNNPSGYVYRSTFLRDLAKIAEENDLIIFDDEAYRSLTYDREFISMAGFCRRSNIIIINSFSKQFAMTGWRVGYVVAEKEFIDAVIKFQQNMAVCVATPNQYAALEAMTNADGYSEMIRGVFRRRREVLTEQLGRIPKLKFQAPQGTFYAFIDISATGMDSRTFCFSLLEKERVAVIPGLAFGEAFDSYIRLAFTINEERIAEGARRIASFLSE